MPRNIHKIRKTVEVDKENYEWYIETHHLSDDINRTGFNNLVDLLLESYREVCTEDKVDLKTLTKQAARNVKEKEEDLESRSSEALGEATESGEFD